MIANHTFLIWKFELAGIMAAVVWFFYSHKTTPQSKTGCGFVIRTTHRGLFTVTCIALKRSKKSNNFCRCVIWRAFWRAFFFFFLFLSSLFPVCHDPGDARSKSKSLLFLDHYRFNFFDFSFSNVNAATGNEFFRSRNNNNNNRGGKNGRVGC